MFYQFWSAHPDGWFAALTVLAWSLSRRLVAEPEADPVPRVLALGATLFVAILLKNYGLVLLVSCPLYLLWHLRARCAPIRGGSDVSARAHSSSSRSSAPSSRSPGPTTTRSRGSRARAAAWASTRQASCG